MDFQLYGMWKLVLKGLVTVKEAGLAQALGLFEGTVCPHVLPGQESCSHRDPADETTPEGSLPAPLWGVPYKLVKVPLWYQWLREALLHLLLGPLLL